MKYKFNIGDKIITRRTKETGEVIDRRSVHRSLMHMNLLSKKYYTVMFQHKYNPGNGSRTINLSKAERPEKDLEKLVSTN